MDSWPPATTMRLSPWRMACAPAPRSEAGAAHHVDAQAGVEIECRCDGGLAGRILPLARRSDLAQDDFADVLRATLARSSGPGWRLTQSVAGNGCEGAAERPHGRAGAET